MNLTIKALVVAATMTLAAPLVAGAQEIKIGYVNAERVLREANMAKVAQSKLEAEFKKRESDLSDLGNTLRAAAEKFDKEAPTLPESERTRRQRDLAEQDREFQRRRRAYMEDINQRKNEEWAALSERTTRVIKALAESEKYDLIVQEVTYAGPRVDITKKVIDALNASK